MNERTGYKVYVEEKKLGILSRCLQLPEEQLLSHFTTDPTATPIHVCSWGTLGETWPFFRPNFVNIEQLREQNDAQEVRSALTG